MFFVALYTLKMLSQFETDTILEIALQGIIMVQACQNTLYYIRIYESVNFMITMSARCLAEAKGFIGLLVLALLAFCKTEQILQMGVNDPEHEYDDIHGDMLKMAF